MPKHRNPQHTNLEAQYGAVVNPFPKELPSQRPVLHESEATAEDLELMEVENELAVPDDDAPEGLMETGRRLAAEILDVMQKVDLGTTMTRSLWEKDLSEMLLKTPRDTVIGVYGGTGSGKSTLLNAVLKRKILPTSPAEACTSVVIEISYNKEKKFCADISFLTRDEWTQELTLLRDDLLDEHDIARQPIDLGMEAAIAWSKIHAVYPSLAYKNLINLTPDQIIDSYPNIEKLLGGEKQIVHRKCDEFAPEIRKYIAPSLEGDKAAISGPSLTDGDEGATIWPLVKLVKIKCHNPILLGGVKLVDLPGVADSNAARNTIAQNYMKICDHIWLVAQIPRASNNKTIGDFFDTTVRAQRDQLKNARCNEISLTFIATKTDDIMSFEITPLLDSERNPQYMALSAQLEASKALITSNQRRERKNKKTLSSLIKDVSLIEAALEGLEHRRNAEVSESSTPLRLRKRKATGSGSDLLLKKRKVTRSSGISNDNSDSGSDLTDTDDLKMELLSLDVEEDSKKGQFRDKHKQEYNDIKASKLSQIAELKGTLETLSREGKDYLENAKRLRKIEARMCSLRRSEMSRSRLQKSFRESLRRIDQIAAERQNPDTYDPRTDTTDYKAPDIPVYTCSSRDYLFLTSGDTSLETLYDNEQDTGIPDLQQRVVDLAISRQKLAADAFLAGLHSSIQGILCSYSEGPDASSTHDQLALELAWKGVGSSANSGCKDRLRKNLYAIIDKGITSIQQRIHARLETPCSVGATKAEELAPKAVEQITSGMHNSTYRATLRYDGRWKTVDVNKILIAPLEAEILPSWANVFEADLFGSIKAELDQCVRIELDILKQSVASSLSTQYEKRRDIVVHVIDNLILTCITSVRQGMSIEQREASRGLYVGIKQTLRRGYLGALAETGRGSHQRQKKKFAVFLEGEKSTLYLRLVDTLLKHLDEAVLFSGITLAPSVMEILEKVETSIADLWEFPQSQQPTELAVRRELLRRSKKALAIVENLQSSTGARG